MTTETVPVTQADRDSAAKLSHEFAMAVLSDKVGMAAEVRAQAFSRHRVEATLELEAQLAEARRIIKGWADWHRFVENDPTDDLPYLNGKAWDDAEVLGEKARAFLSRTGGEA